MDLRSAGVEGELKRMGADDNYMLIASGGDDVRGMTAPGPRRLETGDTVRPEQLEERGQRGQTADSYGELQQLRSR